MYIGISKVSEVLKMKSGRKVSDQAGPKIYTTETHSCIYASLNQITRTLLPSGPIDERIPAQDTEFNIQCVKFLISCSTFLCQVHVSFGFDSDQIFE